ncbi:LamG-like jellyroll fold domain-containing protein [Roseibacillus ishigakijimensis]|uniref:PQQ-dependent sugar dehydrogenase n=1 Tax=Roseibacillus ishigakijimensis TaxID=454146 RepID=A0A934VMM8_9BACT|nr:LamG-like jellyroll fold domain-containing protein [Roseibacillus ishigakijimensis]MBK1834256.1 PQQ-dependent sugar dehydrogenase [Roseibacillus ishigakijimensis]
MKTQFFLRLSLALAATLLGAPLSPGELLHRWSFNEAPGEVPSGTLFLDSIAQEEAVLRGEFQQRAVLTGAALHLPGTSNGNHSLGFMSPYLDLPNGLISAHPNLTVEVWAAPLGVENFDRIFDFGRCRSQDTSGPEAAEGEIVDINGQGSIPGATAGEDTLAMTFAVGNDEEEMRMLTVKEENFALPGAVQDVARVTALGQTYHYVMTFADGVGLFGATGGRVSWYRNSELLHQVDVDFRLEDFEDVNNWLGRSQWTNDFNAEANYHEFRIWNEVLSAEKIGENFAAGPDSLTAVDLPEADHLWTFNQQANSELPSGEVFVDEIGGQWTATLRGQGGALNGREVVLPGTTTGNEPERSLSAYLDLSNGILSASANVTFEAWVRPLSSRTWQRLFDFGRTVQTSGAGALPGEILDGPVAPGFTGAYDNLSLTLNNGDDFNAQQLEGEFADNGPVFTASQAETVAGEQYHMVLVVEDQVGEFGANGCRVSYYRDGILQNSDDFNFRVVDLADVNNWIGRSMYTGDSNSHLALDELRIYRQSLTAGEVFASYVSGPDPDSGPPEPPVPAPVPVRKWDFNTAPGSAPPGQTFLDSGVGEEATLRGQGGSLTGRELVLPGNGNGYQTAEEISAYLDLPNGLISRYDDLSVEIWLTPREGGSNWQRVFDFGNCTTTHGEGTLTGEVIDDEFVPEGYQASDNLFLSLNVQNTLGVQRLGAKLNGGAETGRNTDLSSLTEVGTEYHYVMTVEAGAGGESGCLVKWYREGELQGSIEVPFRLRDLDDVNNWIGRSNWGADNNSAMSINELRIYDRAISHREVRSSFSNGPDFIFPVPEAVADGSPLHLGQRVVLPVLANDQGGPLAETLTIAGAPSVGTAEVLPGGKILYRHAGEELGPVSFTYAISGIGGELVEGEVVLQLTDQLRLNGPVTSTLPLEPPATELAVVDAFPGLFFNRPVSLASPPGDQRRLFVSEIGGGVKVIPDVTASSATAGVVLDLNEAIAGRDPNETIEGGANQELGLLGLAFHPEYEVNGYFFASYTVRKAGLGFFQRLSRFTVPLAEREQAIPQADVSSELILLEQFDEGANHQGGDLHFGSDGYLYLSLGDEENPFDFRLNSQRIDKDFFSGLIRIDVDKREGNLEPNPHPAVPTDEGLARYSVPADNPWVEATEFLDQSVDSSEVRTEFYAVGLRSPWRFSIDRETGEIWVGDVGQNLYEEINLIEKGGNYGWVFREGAHDVTEFNAGWPEKPANFNEIAIDPLYEYEHTAAAGDPLFEGNSVTGGVVYRGQRIPQLSGKYLFGDQVSGHLWALARDEGAVMVERIGGLSYISSFGHDPSNGDVLITYTPAGAANSESYGLKRLVAATPEGTFPETLSATGLFAEVAALAPQPGLLPYEPRLTFWSDHARKQRWFSLPAEEMTMTWRREEPWIFPSGQIWVKHFEMESVRGVPESARRIETRILVKNETGLYGVSYRWNEEESEASLVADGGESFPLSVEVEGILQELIWSVPSRGQCLTCHTAAGGLALSFNTRQLNREGQIHGSAGNVLALLAEAGYLGNELESVGDLPRHVGYEEAQATLEERVRSYLAVNCAYCHQPGGGASGWDGRSPLTLEETGLVRGLVAAPRHAADRLVVPGEVARSVVVSRMAEREGYTRMPPLASSVVDDQGVALLTAWIESELPERNLYADWAAGYALTGAREEDDDGDGLSNYEEYLWKSDPTEAASLHPLTLGEEGQLAFRRESFRRYQLWSSTSLAGDWELWRDWSGAEDYRADAVEEVVPTLGEGDVRRFFRLQVTEP